MPWHAYGFKLTSDGYDAPDPLAGKIAANVSKTAGFEAIQTISTAFGSN
jgi:hypothetical protein